MGEKLHGIKVFEGIVLSRLKPCQKAERPAKPKRTMTNDRGQEFSDHRNYTGKVKIKVFFCDPYSSYQRGTNENRIGLLRQYFPKKTDIAKLSNSDLEKVEFEINNRPLLLGITSKTTIDCPD
ncbi:MAG: IS30 family transposase [Bdellovibrionales bacterium]|nr:IS30 family transposase [Bdellovibrionales bacterium]